MTTYTYCPWHTRGQDPQLMEAYARVDGLQHVPCTLPGHELPKHQAMISGVEFATVIALYFAVCALIYGPILGLWREPLKTTT